MCGISSVYVPHPIVSRLPRPKACSKFVFFSHDDFSETDDVAELRCFEI